MKGYFRLWVISFVLLSFGSAIGQNRLAEHVVLISVDGLRPDFYLDAGWPAPTLQKMAGEGVYAEKVRGVFPSVTYPSHTTMVTGALPERHGVFYNHIYDPAGDPRRWFWEDSFIRVPTLWTAVADASLTSAALFWPVTVDAPIKWLVPEIWPLDSSDPIDILRAKARPSGLIDEIERKATGELTSNNLIRDYLSRDIRVSHAGAYLLSQYQPNLLAIHLLATDHFQHEVGRNGDPVKRAVAVVDTAISLLIETARKYSLLDDTAFVVTGDHGFVTTHTALRPNVWLIDAGFRGDELGIDDWKATFHVESASAFLHLRDGTDEHTAEQVRQLLKNLPSAVRKLFRVVETDELKKIGADSRAVLALAARKGIRFSGSTEDPVVVPGPGGTHGYFPSDFDEIQTGFIGWGAGFKKGQVVHEMGLEQVAPVIARLLGLPFDPPDSVLIPGLLDSP